jgi:hypothetical protein
MANFYASISLTRERFLATQFKETANYEDWVFSSPKTGLKGFRASIPSLV